MNHLNIIIVILMFKYNNCFEYNLNHIFKNSISEDNEYEVKSSESPCDWASVRVDLYYESLCPACRSFDSTTFVDAVKQMGSCLYIHTYPYGNAKTTIVNGHINITCQHGPAECYGNKLHACAIDILGNITQAVIYNSCMMSNNRTNRGSDDRAADECGHLLNIDSEPIKYCAKSKRGDRLLFYYGEESKKVHYDGVPYVLIDGVSSDPDKFMHDLCEAFLYPPLACHKYLFTPNASQY